MLSDAIEANRGTYICGADLDLQGFAPLSDACRPYVPMKMDCSTNVELQLFSSGILPTRTTDHIFDYCCGAEGSRREVDSEAVQMLPVCDPCLKQHKKARASGRNTPAFDRSIKAP